MAAIIFKAPPQLGQCSTSTLKTCLSSRAPADARRRALPVSVLAWGLGGRRCRSGNDFTAQLRVWCQHAVEPDQMETRAGHQGRQALHELQRLHDECSS